MEIEVYGLQCKLIGVAKSFGEAKRMQKAALPEELRVFYAGIQNGNPLFYSSMNDELKYKYNID